MFRILQCDQSRSDSIMVPDFTISVYSSSCTVRISFTADSCSFAFSFYLFASSWQYHINQVIYPEKMIPQCFTIDLLYSMSCALSHKNRIFKDSKKVPFKVCLAKNIKNAIISALTLSVPSVSFLTFFSNFFGHRPHC